MSIKTNNAIRRVTAFLMAIMILLSSMPLNAFAQGNDKSDETIDSILRIDNKEDQKDKLPPVKHKVEFDSNGGTGSMDTIEVEHGEKITVPENKFNPPSGKEFTSWDLEGKDIKEGEEIVVNKDLTLKAKYAGGGRITLL